MAGEAARLWASAQQLEEVAAVLKWTVPQDWRGMAAENYRVSVGRAAGQLSGAVESVRFASALARSHEAQVQAVRTALTGGSVAV